ncbi:MAG TPA: DNA-binding protein WhiA [Bacilli bacterium]|nr:DNA-binding protein WhiA [Bacilli bacterium]
MISFTARIKEDITFNSVDYSLPRKKAILAGFLRISGYLGKRDNVATISMATESAKVAKYLYQLFKECYNIEPSFNYVTNKRYGKKSMKFIVVVDKAVDEISEELSLNFFSTTIPRSVVYSDDTLAGYITGAFLASGSVTSPRSSNYHLEIVVDNEKLAERIKKMIEGFAKANFSPRVTSRRNKYIVYIKKSDQISEFLIFIGASNASLEYESVRIDRDMQNSTNRMLICDNANYQKTIKSAAEQIENIEIVKKYYGERPLNNEKLEGLMALRLDHEDANLQELADLLSERLGSEKPISKGNINHLFIKLRTLAEPYKKRG